MYLITLVKHNRKLDVYTFKSTKFQPEDREFVATVRKGTDRGYLLRKGKKRPTQAHKVESPRPAVALRMVTNPSFKQRRTSIARTCSVGPGLFVVD